MMRTSSSAAVLGVVIAVVVGALGLDVLLPQPDPEPAVTRTGELGAGSATCAAAVAADGSQVVASTVAAARDGAVPADVGASLRLEVAGDVRDLPAPSTTGTTSTAIESTDGDIAVAARWRDVPLLLSRRWSVGAEQRVPGAVEGPCPAEPAASWYVAGVATAGGAAAQLHLANPTDGPASLAVSFTTPDGPIAPTRLANLAVPAHDRVTIDLNEFVPEEPDLGIVVTTRAGRVVAEALQTLEAAVGGVDGRALAVAHPEPSEVWTVPFVQGSADVGSWLWVTNPSEEPTDVRVVLHTEAGPVVPAEAGVTLAPGTTQRIDLRGPLGEVGAGGVTVRAGAPVVVGGAVLRSVADDAVRSGIALVEATPAWSGPGAALTAVGTTGVERRLAITNPGEEPATVDVAVVTGGPPASLAAGVVVPAGAWVEIPLGEGLPAEEGFAILLDVTEGEVAAAVVASAVEGPLDLMAIAVRPFPTEVTVVERPVREDRTVMHPMRQPVTDPAPTSDDAIDAGDTDEPAPAGTETDADAPAPTEADTEADAPAPTEADTGVP